ncbi:MAG: hypothetical protein CL610_25820 [Anaerolineaceae bacterium]|nr:hypothetical protein [Anaerolineaceae bacterium]
MNNPSIPSPDAETSLEALKALVRQRNLLAALRVFHAHMGEIFHLKLLSLEAIMLVGPDANRFVLVTHRDKFLWRNEADPVVALLREGVLVTDGDMHDMLRRQMNPSLHRKALTGYVEGMWRATDAITSQWPGTAASIEMLAEMRKITLLTLVESLFRVDLMPDLERMWQPILKSIAYISPGLWLLWPGVPRPGYAARLKTMNDYLYAIIQQRRAVFDAENAEDLLGLLIAGGLDDDSIRDQLLTILIAGHDTSTALLTWVLYLLTTHPETLHRAQAEVDTVLGTRPPEMEDLSQLGYLGQVIDETLRLSPPIHLGSRIVAEDLIFNGYTLPAGSRVMYSIYLAHRDPNHWPEPDTFNPDRFSAENKRRILPYAYLPFGGGARNCIGTAFGLVEAKIILARILQQFDLTFTGHPVKLKMGATLEPKPGVRIVARRRVTG